MKITITGRKVNLKGDFKELVEKKLSKFERIFSADAQANVTVTVGKNRETVEITINQNGMIYRAENTTMEMNESLDKTIDSLKRQIRKNKTRLEKRLKSSSLAEFINEEKILCEDEKYNDDYNESEYKVVRSKQFSVKPLDVEEAILQMNMIGHKFYMFRNFGTNQINVVYVRKNGTYGLLEPDIG